jgi:hypothetical protein
MGNAYVFDGSSGAMLHKLESPNPESGGLFGFSVSGTNDLDGDGRGDAIVGAYGEDNYAGRAYAFSGATGLLIHTFVSPNAEQAGSEDFYEYGGQFGYSVSGVADANGDGFGDVVVGAFREGKTDYAARGRTWHEQQNGRAYVFDGLTGELLHALVSPNPERDGLFGTSVSGMPDINGDGLSDIAVGARNEDYQEGHFVTLGSGRAYIFDGSTGALLQTFISPNKVSDGRFGGSVSGIFDANGDGLGDLIVGANHEASSTSPNKAGRAYMYFSPFLLPEIHVDWESIAFGDRNIVGGPSGPVTVKIENRGRGDLLFISRLLLNCGFAGCDLGEPIDLGGPDADEFVLTGEIDTSRLVPGASREIAVAFDPASLGAQLAFLGITTNDPVDATVEISLTGRGVLFTPTPTSTPGPTHTPTPTPTTEPRSADLNHDLVVNHKDLLEFLKQWAGMEKDEEIGSADLYIDDVIDDWDLFEFDRQWDPAPPIDTKGR